ncbi:hypothetical protein MG293_020443 [Ovis ammon polii]|uniref:Uncharacterized protein n=1 Tax=Ovis ammon polii TaxID=230172 RepID=A0AAD4XX31_OVIAM|nr:hypothetical protein MG293_020443 [Ovis ammon polii]
MGRVSGSEHGARACHFCEGGRVLSGWGFGCGFAVPRLQSLAAPLASDQELLKRQGPLVIFSTVLTTTESPGIDCSSKAQPATPTWCLLVADASIAGLTGTFIQVFKLAHVASSAHTGQ